MLKFLFVLVLLQLFGPAAYSYSESTVTSVASINIRVETRKDSLNPWSARKHLLFGFIKKQDLDVVCMQEVKPRQYVEIRDSLNDYSSVGKGDDGQREANPVFFKSSKFDCLDYGTFWLSETPDSAGSKGWDAKYPRMATWVVLRDKVNNNVFCVVNTHLDHIGKIARIKGMGVVKSRIKGMNMDCPIVLTGDFNCSSLSEPYIVGMEKEFPMYDSYVVAEERHGVSYTYQRFGTSHEHRSDYIFVTPSLRIKSINIPKEQSINGVYMSDHNPVIVFLEL